MEYDQDRQLYYDPSLGHVPDTVDMSFDYEEMYNNGSFQPGYRSSSVTDSSHWTSPMNGSPNIPAEDVKTPRARPKKASNPVAPSQLKSEILQPQTTDGVSKERRRKKNRQAQAAFRERQKKVIDDLRQDVTRYVQYNHLLKRKMYDMLAKMEMMKMGFEEALALEPQLMSANFLRTGVLELRDSPAPSSEASHGDFCTD